MENLNGNVHIASSSLTNDKQIFINHLEKYIGSKAELFKTVESSLFNLDIFHFSPNASRPYHTFVTYGMSSLNMNVPYNRKECKCCELSITLPATWKITDNNSYNMDTYWPIQLIIDTAYFPFNYNAWFYIGSILNSEIDYIPTIMGTQYSGLTLLPNFTLPIQFGNISLNDKLVRIYSIVPLFDEELMCIATNGLEKLLSGFFDNKINEVINVTRTNTCEPKKRRRI